jgi:hypothetical protein
MDDIAAMLAEAVARRIKAAQAQAQAQALQRGAPAGAVRPAATRPPAPVAKPSVPMGQPPRPAVSAAPAAIDALPAAVLPGLPTTILDDGPAQRPALLSAFSGAGLLSAIVLSEALAPPLSLRDPQVNLSRSGEA